MNLIARYIYKPLLDELADAHDENVRLARQLAAVKYANDALLKRNAELSDSLNRHLQAAVYDQ